MKFKVLSAVLCVIFFIFSTNIGVVYSSSPEHIEFVYGEKVFDYHLSSNIKSSNVFTEDFELKKYNRFSAIKERQQLLARMINLGFDKEIALEYLFPNINKKIDSIGKNLYVKPKNATLKIDSNSKKVFNIKKEIVGYELNKSVLIDEICSSYINNKTLTFNIPILKINPSITENDLKKFSNLRADFSSNISSSSPDRKHNIKNALMSLNKIEIYPNQIFSFNKAVGRRTAENGYREAKIIVNNEFVDGLGGGVCQVSSTLYNSALLAGLEIIEANKHSKQVSYVPFGFDAMVNFGSSDLKFRNNTNEKLTIITNYTSSSARIRIFGESLNITSYKLRNEVFNIEKPTEEVLIDEQGKYLDKVVFDDEYFYLKNASTGMEIKSFRDKYINNSLVSTELLRFDKFKVQNAIKVYGAISRENNL